MTAEDRANVQQPYDDLRCAQPCNIIVVCCFMLWWMQMRVVSRSCLYVHIGNSSGEVGTQVAQLLPPEAI